MRIAGFRIERFGTIDGWQEEGLEASDLIVALGPNESGKSTLREFVTTLLFGFSPATRDSHPYAPSEAGAFGGALQLVEGGERISVVRHLKATPRGRLHRPTRHEELDNRPLSAVGAIGRAVFADVHSISAEEVAAISPRAWRAVEEGLLAGSALTFLRSAADVRRALEEDAARAWRADRRGAPAARAIEATIAERRRGEREAAERGRRLVEVEHELEELVAGERVVRDRSDEREARRRRHERLAPALLADEHVAGQRREADSLLAVDDLPTDPEGTLERLRASAERAAAAISEAGDRIEELEAAIVLGRGAEALVDRAGDVREAAFRTSTRDAAVAAIAAARSDAEQRERAVARRAGDLLGRPIASSDEAALARVDLGSLRGAVARRERAGAIRPARAPLVIAAGAAAALAILAAIGTAGRVGPLVGAVAALAVAFVGLRGGDRRAAREAAGAIDAALGELAILPARRAHPDAALVTELAELTEALDARRTAAVEARRREAALAADDAARAALLDELGFADASGAMAAVDGARDRQASASAAARSLVRAREELAAQETALTVTRAERDTLLRRLAVIAPEPSEAVRRALRARSLRAAADAVEQAAMRDDAAHAGLVAEARGLVAAGVELVLDPTALAALDRDQADDRAGLERLSKRRGELEAERRHLAAGPSAADLAGEIGALTDQLADVLRRRDRLALGASILAQAERRYREAHDPRFLAVASGYLASITAGRYRRVAVIDEAAGEGAPRLALVRHDDEVVVVAPPLSRGTLEQVYVALRLALVDEVDPERTAPLFLDEALVHWDDDRVDAFLPILTATGGRQVFVATCHPQLADRLAAHGARVLHLPGVGAGNHAKAAVEA